MVKTAIFLSGVACGFAVASAMTDDQRNAITQRVTGGRTPTRIRSASSPSAPSSSGWSPGPAGSGNGVVDDPALIVGT
jgi:hypothetical protein